MEYLEEQKHIIKAVYEAASSNNLDEIKQLLFTSSFPKMPQEFKEKLIFMETMTYIEFFDIGQNILHYLIFDYKINEEVCNQKEPKLLLTKAKEMFAARKEKENFYFDLNSNLNSNNDKVYKKPKI